MRKRVGVSVVRDVSSGDLIIKLVNLLPVSVNAELELPSLKGKNVSAVKTVLAGQPNDAKARPVSGNMEVSEQFLYEMPAYSFSIIRIQE